MVNKEVESILQKYGRRLEEKDFGPSNLQELPESSKEFQKFKEDMLPSFSIYEKMCLSLGSFVKLKLSKKDEDSITKDIVSARIDVRASQVVFLACFFSFITFFFGLLFTMAIYFFTDYFSIPLIFLSVIASSFIFYFLYKMPSRLANEWRLRAGNQMVPCILYMVIYMKHTSNIERAINFAAQHLEPPLSLDFKKVFWNVEVGRYSSIKESLDAYLETWRFTNPEFIESFNLIESSLYEQSENRRIQILERALQVILEGVYDKMLKYTHSVKSPLTNIYMLGIVLPTLGLALLPLASVLVGSALRWPVVMMVFNVLIPFFVYYMTSEIVMNRPGGYGESSMIELNPNYSSFKTKKGYWRAGVICVPLLLIGLFPLINYFIPVLSLLGLKQDYSFAEIGLSFFGNLKLFDYIKGVGPMGLFSLFCSFFIPLSLFLFFSIGYREKSKLLIESRNKSKILEGEFTNSLFQLGNRMGDGTPAEIAFGKVSESSKGMATEEFFRITNNNMRSLGFSLEKALFDKRRGAIIYFPSNLISTSMHILIKSVKKGLKVAAESLMSIAEYIKNVNKINERLRDLLAEIISDMKSNMTFLAPLLSGIVVGLAAMITLILSKLAEIINVASLSGGEELAGIGGIADLLKNFNVESLMPPYYLQIIVGVYILEIIFILSRTLVNIDAGKDNLKEVYEISNNLRSAGLLYIIVALISVLALSALAGVALSNISL